MGYSALRATGQVVRLGECSIPLKTPNSALPTPSLTVLEHFEGIFVCYSVLRAAGQVFRLVEYSVPLETLDSALLTPSLTVQEHVPVTNYVATSGLQAPGVR